MLRRLPIHLLSLSLVVSAVGQSKPTLKPDDYKQWEVLAGARISDDGRWLAYGINRVDADGNLVIKSSDGPQSASIPGGGVASFSDDSKWAAYLISPPKAVADKLRADKKPVETKLGLRNLEGGQERLLESVRSFDFLKGSRFLVAHRFRGASKAEGGSDLTIVDLSNGRATSIGNVVAYAANHDENLLAIQTESDSGEKGVVLYNPATRTLNQIALGKEPIANLTWADKADVLALLVGTMDEKKESPAFRVMVVSDVRADQPKLRSFDPTARKDFPEGQRIAEVAPLALSDDGSSVAFGIQQWRDKPKPPQKPEDKAGVEVWNTKDVRVMPRQKLLAAADRNKTALCVWHLGDDSFRQIGDGDVQSAFLLRDFDHAVLTDPTPYQSAATNGFDYDDVWLVDTRTGEKTQVVTKTHWPVIPSRLGRYLTFYQGQNWWMYDVKGGKRRNLTGDVKAPFEDTEDDHTVPEKGPAGFPIWMQNDDGVLLSDNYDVWLARPTGGPLVQLTQGRKDQEIYRFDDIDPADEEGPSLSKPLYFYTLDTYRKSTGYYACDANGKGKQLIEQDARLAGLIKSKSTDRVLFTMGTYEQSPNLYLTNTTFSAIKPESKTNPQQANFAWGKTELIDFKSRWGKPLHGVLIYPADYVKGRSYPMVTYIYERLSDELHNYTAPAEFSPYNVQVLSQNGYFVFKPDIAYQPRNPGKSAVDCLEPAVNAVLAKNVGVNPARIGLIGHSWGGYQTAFVTTVSKAFAVGVAGAPLTELTSMYNSFYWNSGISDQQLLETGQGRLEVPFWEDPKVYFENSPVWQSAKRTAPILIAQGDADGAVDWHQGMYLFQTLRRMGKNAVFLLYAGENHNFTRRPDQLDYSRRLRHFLDVYLKGVKPEPWVTDGVPYLKKDD